MQDVHQFTDSRAVIRACIDALRNSYDAINWPADGSSRQEIVAAQAESFLNSGSQRGAYSEAQLRTVLSDARDRLLGLLWPVSEYADVEARREAESDETIVAIESMLASLGSEPTAEEEAADELDFSNEQLENIAEEWSLWTEHPRADRFSFIAGAKTILKSLAASLGSEPPAEGGAAPRWVKAKETEPKLGGYYYCKVDTKQDSIESVIVEWAEFRNGLSHRYFDWDLKNVDGTCFGEDAEVIEWLNESAAPAPAKEEGAAVCPKSFAEYIGLAVFAAGKRGELDVPEDALALVGRCLQGFAAAQPSGEAAEGAWAVVAHTRHNPATNNYEDSLEITNGEVSFFTKGDDELLVPIVNALNASGCVFYAPSGEAGSEGLHTCIHCGGEVTGDDADCFKNPENNELGSKFFERNVRNPYPSNSQSHTAWERGFEEAWDLLRAQPALLIRDVVPQTDQVTDTTERIENVNVSAPSGEAAGPDYDQRGLATQVQDLYRRLSPCPLKDHLARWFDFSNHPFIEEDAPSGEAAGEEGAARLLQAKDRMLRAANLLDERAWADDARSLLADELRESAAALSAAPKEGAQEAARPDALGALRRIEAAVDLIPYEKLTSTEEKIQAICRAALVEGEPEEPGNPAANLNLIEELRDTVAGLHQVMKDRFPLYKHGQNAEEVQSLLDRTAAALSGNPAAANRSYTLPEIDAFVLSKKDEAYAAYKRKYGVDAYEGLEYTGYEIGDGAIRMKFRAAGTAHTVCLDYRMTDIPPAPPKK